ncbi:sensor histidine kinase [Paenibacillus hexagrammi]|uniref:histidine kinase n=1 Tax=Paenibacillus hexagrammi TaxID=2908839 RepID=A0ABY3SMK4_9BACL|nr:histidine kinase [Paenibacillus sp. YPD9-1]UJF34431.1 histidine kinase [Paenibacillus sp. YPD9-1]
MSLRTLKLLTILLPVIIIGGFEYLRHEFLLNYLSMKAGNWVITGITLVLSYFFASWMFESIGRINVKLAAGEARRAVYEERERLARELHDDLAQTLFFLNVKLKQGSLEEAKAAVSEIDNSLRQAIFNLRTPPEEASSFPSRLHKWLLDWQAVTGVQLQEQIEIAEQSFHSGEEMQLFGIIQEAFTNIRKHSMATEASLVFTASPIGWRLHIRDNGCGLSEQKAGRKKYGIELMRKRAGELGAVLEVRSAENGPGTELLAYAEERRNEL